MYPMVSIGNASYWTFTEVRASSDEVGMSRHPPPPPFHFPHNGSPLFVEEERKGGRRKEGKKKNGEEKGEKEGKLPLPSKVAFVMDKGH